MPTYMSQKKDSRSTHLLGFVEVGGGGVIDLDALGRGRVEDFGVIGIEGSFVVSIQYDLPMMKLLHETAISGF